MPSEPFEENRRRWTKRVLSSTLAVSVNPVRFARSPAQTDDSSTPQFIVRNDRPLNVETPLQAFETWLTPVDRFFVRNHFAPPPIQLHPWRLQVSGLVARPVELNLGGLGEIEKFETASVHAVLQCAGNGRALYEPIIPGVAWQFGAVGNGEWSGFRLGDLLQAAGLSAQASHVHFYPADAPPHPKTPAFIRSIPLSRALDPSTILATMQNGEPLRAVHGGPVRLIVPGWTGNHWMKWVRSIVVSDSEAPGFYQRTGYKMPIKPVAPGETPKPEDMVSVTELNVKSLITSPTRDATLQQGDSMMRGFAWTGMGAVERVEVSIDSGPYQPAVIEQNPHKFAWRQWSYPVRLAAGLHTISARATDDRGNTQPEKTPWNKSGYLWNGIHSIRVQVS